MLLRHNQAKFILPWRIAGIQGALSPLVRFLGSFFLERERMNI
jgi:hypothetical protein